VVKPLGRIRMTRNAAGQAEHSTLQISLTPTKAGKTSVTFHMEKLADAAEREAMRGCCRDVLDRLGKLLA
jgi:hypothetical protein